MELNKQRPQKQLSQPGPCVLEHQEVGRSRGSQTSEGSDPAHVPAITTSPPYSAPGGPVSEGSTRDWDSGEILG